MGKNGIDEKLLKQVQKEILQESKKHQNEASFILTHDFIAEQIVEFPEHRTIARITGRNAGDAGGAGGFLGMNFIKYTLEKDTWEKVNNVVIDGIEYKPTESPLIDEESTVLILPSGCKEYGTDEDLINEIQEYIHSYLEVSPFQESILAYFVLFTWVHDAFPFTIYIHFVGTTTTGKSRAIDTLSQICYKSLRGSGSITTASLFRVSDQFQGTLFLNEFELGRRSDEGYNEKVLILKAGSENYSVFRTEGEGKKRVEKYKLKIPKVFSGEKAMLDPAMESRTISVPMSKKTRRIPLYAVNKFYNRGEELRCKLLLWRMRHLTKINISDIEYGFPELERFDSRIQQLLTPIYYLVPDFIKKNIIEYMENMENEIMESRREELSGQIFVLLFEGFETNLRYSLKALTDKLNETAKFKYTYRKIGSVITKELGFVIKEEGHDKVRYPQYDEKLIEKLKSHFGITKSYLKNRTQDPQDPQTEEESDSTPQTDIENAGDL